LHSQEHVSKTYVFEQTRQGLSIRFLPFRELTPYQPSPPNEELPKEST
jgi:hypothetical protein